MKVRIGTYITRKGVHAHVKATSALKAFGYLSGSKKPEEWTIEGKHKEQEKDLVRKHG
jgi:hypothetical protein